MSAIKLVGFQATRGCQLIYTIFAKNNYFAYSRHQTTEPMMTHCRLGAVNSGQFGHNQPTRDPHSELLPRAPPSLIGVDQINRDRLEFLFAPRRHHSCNDSHRLDQMIRISTGLQADTVINPPMVGCTVEEVYFERDSELHTD